MADYRIVDMSQSLFIQVSFDSSHNGIYGVEAVKDAGRNPFLFRSALIRVEAVKDAGLTGRVAIPFYSGQL